MRTGDGTMLLGDGGGWKVAAVTGPAGRPVGSTAMAIEIRPVTDDEFPAMFHALYRGFGEDPPDDDPDGTRLAAVLPAERTVAAFDGDRIVGTLGDYDLRCTCRAVP